MTNCMPKCHKTCGSTHAVGVCNVSSLRVVCSFGVYRSVLCPFVSEALKVFLQAQGINEYEKEVVYDWPTKDFPRTDLGK